jgi:hypothetical protein
MATKGPAADKKPTTIDITDPGSISAIHKEIGGSRSDHWNILLLNQAAQSLWTGFSDQEVRDRQFKATVSALIGIGPKDEIEGMIAAQLLAAHNAAMECYRRAMLTEQTFEGRRESLNQANKLSRTHAALAEALNRHRGKGQQKVTVEHVHVHSGGQAVVGVVESSPVGNRSKSEKNQNARQIANAPQPAMRSPNAGGEPVPVTSDAERPLSDARGQITRRSKG